MDRQHDRVRRELSGEPVSPGVAIAHALLFKQIALDALEMTSFPVEDIHKEVNRLDLAIRKSREQLVSVSERVNERKGENLGEIFKAQIQMLEDNAFIQELKSLVKSQMMNVEHVIASQIRVLETRFESIHDEVIKTKFLDVQDVYHRILRNLLEIEHVRTNPMQRIDKPVIFISEKLVPSDIALLDLRKVQGIILEEGSRVSHVTVMSKSLGIPAVIQVPGAASLVRSGDQIVLDGYTGKILINPHAAELSSYREKLEAFVSTKTKRTSRHEKGCETLDGRHIRLEANIGSINEAEEAVANGADGIGLLRSELFYMSKNKLPALDDESEFYRKIIGILKRRPITIRLLDLGADKSLPYLTNYEEENPQLGIRGIRYLLRHPDLFHKHVRSILSVSKLAPIKIAIPFIATIEDLNHALALINQDIEELSINRRAIAIGIMAEIPSMALALRTFLSRVDFVNIGTNDLVQYLFAASREDGNVESYRQNLHPVVIRLIRNVVSSAAFLSKDVSICGEMASDPLMAALLVGTGATSLSMQPGSIPIVRDMLQNYSFLELQKVTRKVLSLDSAEQVEKVARESLGIVV